MELKIIDQNEKVVLSRTEVKAEASFTGAVPSRDEVKKALASQLKADEKLIVIKHIFSKFKSNKADVLAYYYINEDDLKKIEQKKKKPKKKAAKEGEAPKEEAPKKEAPKEEKPAEKKAPKEEKKPEAKEEKGDKNTRTKP